MRSTWRVVASSVVFVLVGAVVAGCSEDPPDAQPTETSTVIADRLADSGLRVSESELACVVRSLEEDGFRPESIRSEVAAGVPSDQFSDTLFRSLGSCAEDLSQMLTEFLMVGVAQTDSGDQVSEDDARCIVATVEASGYDARDFVADAVGREPELATRIRAATISCLGGDPSTATTEAGAPFGYGDSPELDALYDACGGGDMSACDDLYIVSPSNSDYEAFGDSCGGLERAGGGFCVRRQ